MLGFLTLTDVSVYLWPDSRLIVLIYNIFVNCVALGINKIEGVHNILHMIMGGN